MASVDLTISIQSNYTTTKLACGAKMSATVWSPDSGSWYISTHEGLTSSANERAIEFDIEKADGLTPLPLGSIAACGKPYVLPASLAASSADLQCTENTIPPNLVPGLSMELSDYLSEIPYYGFTPEEPIIEEVSATLDLGASFDCTALPEHISFNGKPCTHPLPSRIIPADSSHNTSDPISALLSTDNSKIPTPDAIRYSTPASAPAQASDFDSKLELVGNLNLDNQRWHATKCRSRAADRSFLYGVLTTKVFCRPSCASRRPSRRHVRFFPFPGAIEAAEQANFRPCKRCIPEAYGVKISGALKVCQVLRTIIAQAFDIPEAWSKPAMKLECLAKLAGLSTFHFHRLFRAIIQVAPRDFVHACRALALQDALRRRSHPDFHPLANAIASIESSPLWSPRMIRKALGGLSHADFAHGAPSRLIQYCRAETPCGLLCVIFSADKYPADIKLHTVFFVQEDGKQECQCFPTAQLSHHYEARLQKCVDELEKEGRDRDTELTADVLPTLWRARVWLRFLRD